MKKLSYILVLLTWLFLADYAISASVFAGENGGVIYIPIIDGPIIDIPGEEVGDFGQIIGYVEEVRTVLINESHDGLIPSSSALIRTIGSTYHEFTVSGANHLEMKNHAGIKVCIEDEIDRYMSAQTVIGPVFPIL